MKQPFISINEFNVCKVPSRCFAYLLNWIGKRANTKAQFLSKYSEYSLACCKDRWLRFLKAVFSYNGFVFDEVKWSCEFDKWVNSNCSYSVCCF